MSNTSTMYKTSRLGPILELRGSPNKTALYNRVNRHAKPAMIVC